MGSLLSILNKKSRDCRILCIGLDDAGKTTLIKQMGLKKLYSKAQQKLEDGEEIDITETVPTIGFNVKEIQYKKTKFAIWDLGGQQGIRDLWVHYFEGTDGIIYVMDSSNRARLKECKDQLYKLLANDQLKNAILLVLANKSDKPNALTTTEVIAQMELEEKLGESRPWFVQSISAINGKGIDTGLDWFSNHL
ncbi:ADP-ribosylation factor ARF1 [Acrasis kona]|uniref:ADP-ribosylation factor ARF1 n=1 Tax=Acrasis kona TaxID=1008807 RepID=A0AAW2YGW1_9EUKA